MMYLASELDPRRVTAGNRLAGGKRGRPTMGALPGHVNLGRASHRCDVRKAPLLRSLMHVCQGDLVRAVQC
jgi:hypothetical protein